ncbi:hypothetical protein CISEMA079M_23840 [Citrobacter sedlakii]
MDDVAFHHHVLKDEIRRVGVIRDNAAHFRRRQIHLIDTFTGEEVMNGTTVQQVQFLAGTHDQFHVAALFKLAFYRGTDHPAMAGNENSLSNHQLFLR